MSLREIHFPAIARKMRTSTSRVQLLLAEFFTGGDVILESIYVRVVLIASEPLKLLNVLRLEAKSSKLGQPWVATLVYHPLKQTINEILLDLR